ncbi:MAG TPA: hypothetical protein VH054_04055, partial [Polyangiaceae bacterium]|nr:hypothetical protein [Polyangiaceae bacterium]
MRRSAQLADVNVHEWSEVWSEAGWRVMKRKSKLLVIDPEGYSHPAPPKADFTALSDPIERAAAKACRLESRRAKTLAGSIPSEGALGLLADSTPRNANVRLLRAVRYVDQANVDGVAITGDI